MTISGDVAGLDTLASRGDSLIAAANQDPSTLDSMRAVASGAIAGDIRAGLRPIPGVDTQIVSMTGTLVRPTPPSSPGAELTRRAQARGDSMARAEAMRYSGGASGADRARADSVRGIVELVGSAPGQQPVLRAPDGMMPISLSGMATAGLTRLDGAEIVVRGVRVGPRDIVVAEYLVRAVGGMPAYDGLLEAADDGYSLALTGGGRKRLASVPAGLRDLAGSRVWVSMPANSSTPSAYGLIARR